uniref:Uncharacterized protein n=1 Tax=Cucumis melo TaxID=3656 RepID=A0A9I9E3N8_CUCME
MSFRLDKATRSSSDPTSWGRHCFFFLQLHMDWTTPNLLVQYL